MVAHYQLNYEIKELVLRMNTTVVAPRISQNWKIIKKKSECKKKSNNSQKWDRLDDTECGVNSKLDRQMIGSAVAAAVATTRR